MPTGNTDTITLELPCETKYLQVARLATGGCGSAIDLTIEDVDDLKVAVTEACTNVINHAFDESTAPERRRIIVRFITGADGLQVEVEDEGCGFDPDQIEREKRDSLEGNGGLGFGLIRELTDSMKIESAPGSGTKITMVKRATR
ncbi:MAG: ATP-binding protein [Armatimonadetes bacterium]|nr:ATP-binding protein [Armatimonadota bacterium]